MLLSIVVLSYNRPDQIRRICEKLSIADNSRFNLIIKDDCSPRQPEIEEFIQDYAKSVRFNVIFHKNKNNLGYDRNLIDSFLITEAEYVFLLSDDDYIEGASIDELVKILEVREFKLYFTPYIHAGGTSRSRLSSFSLKSFHHVIYNSVLFSGLIFHRRTVMDMPKDMDFLSNCIYSQVYLAAKVAFEEKSFGGGPDNLLYLGGDGENFFGKNESAVNKDILTDRDSVTANLKYQKFLIKVVDRVARDTNNCLIRSFHRERNRRTISQMLRARTRSMKEYTDFLMYILDPANHFSLFVKCFSVAVILIPRPVAQRINLLFINLLRRSG